VRPARFLYLCIKVCVLPTNTVYIFFFFKGINQRSITYFHFLQCALSYFFIFIPKIVFYLRTQLTMFSSSKGTYQINRCTFKNNIKSHIFTFYSAPCQISLSLHQRFFYLLTKLTFFFSFSKGTYQRKRCTLKKIYKITYLFAVRPVRYLFIYTKICLTK